MCTGILTSAAKVRLAIKGTKAFGSLSIIIAYRQYQNEPTNILSIIYWIVTRTESLTADNFLLYSINPYPKPYKNCDTVKSGKYVPCGNNRERIKSAKAAVTAPPKGPNVIDAIQVGIKAREKLNGPALKPKNLDKTIFIATNNAIVAMDFGFKKFLYIKKSFLL